MKIYAFTDTHSDMRAYKKIKKNIEKEDPDIVICAGDFTNFERDFDEVMYFLSTIDKPVAIIHGNHEDEVLTEEACAQYSNLYFIHLGFVEIDDYVICGFGGGGFSYEYPELNDFREHPEFKKLIKDKKLVFVNHAPPYGTELDKLPDGSFCGSKTLVDFIKKINPIMVFTGHIHPHFGKEVKVSGCRVVNPGPVGKLFIV